MDSPNNFVTDIVTFSYVNVFEPKLNQSNILKYSACLLLDKTNTAERKRWEECVELAIQAGIKKGKFTENQRPILKLPIRDGDEELKTGIKKGQEYAGRSFVNSNAEQDKPPQVTKPQGGQAVPIVDPLEFYSGCKGRAIISFYAFNEGGSRGIAVGLNGVYKVAEGDRLDGRVDASSVFAQYAEEDNGEPDANAGNSSGTFE